MLSLPHFLTSVSAENNLLTGKPEGLESILGAKIGATYFCTRDSEVRPGARAGVPPTWGGPPVLAAAVGIQARIVSFAVR